MAETALVTLHDAHQRVPHVRLAAFAVGNDNWVLATPWPADLTTFALAVTTAQGSSWVTPKGYEVFAVTSDQPTLRIAAIEVDWPAGVPQQVVGGVPKQEFIAAMAVAHADPVAVTAQFVGPALDPLVAPAAAAAGIHPPAGAPHPTTPPVTLTTTPRPNLPAGLCHLFGWD